MTTMTLMTMNYRGSLKAVWYSAVVLRDHMMGQESGSASATKHDAGPDPGVPTAVGRHARNDTRAPESCRLGTVWGQSEFHGGVAAKVAPLETIGWLLGGRR
jgi:hypothetical protein